MEQNQLNTQTLHRQTIFHEAAHVAAIYLGNKQKHLPPVFFEIRIKRPKYNNGEFAAEVVDGQLIQNLSVVPLDNRYDLSNAEKQNCICAYEADAMNLLVGSLAKAKYIAECNNEVLNQNLIRNNILNHLEPSSDTEKAWGYLENFITSQPSRKLKMQEIFNQALQFINYYPHWKGITKLVDYIFSCEKKTISCEESMRIFDQYVEPK